MNPVEKAKLLTSGEIDVENKFSRDDYANLKKKLTEQREAKSRLLKQGFPEIKNYVRI